MAVNFCTRCGNRLTGAARFCDQCGNPLGGEIAGKAGSAVADPQFFERPGTKVRAPGETSEPQEEQTVNGVDSYLLNQMLSMSLMNAPLVSNFLLVTNKEEDWSATAVFISPRQNSAKHDDEISTLRFALHWAPPRLQPPRKICRVYDTRKSRLMILTQTDRLWEERRWQSLSLLLDMK